MSDEPTERPRTTSHPSVTLDERALLDELRAEVETLRRRVIELETASAQRLTPSPLELEDEGIFLASSEILRHARTLLMGLIAHGPDVVFVKDTSGRYALVNRLFTELFDKPPRAVFGKTDYELFPAEVATRIRKVDEDILTAGAVHEYEGMIPTSHGARIFSTLKFPVHDEQGHVIGLAGFSRDVTAFRQAEADRDASHARALDAYATALRELEAPVVPIARGVFAVPLVGCLDAARAAHVEKAVLSGIAERHAAWVILDVTGLRDASGQALASLTRIARSARLLGARVLVSGIRAELAKTLATQNEGQHDFATRATMESAIAFALRLRASH